MSGLVLKLLNMSISASWLVLAVVLLRLLFRKAPKWISCLLWSVVALRLVMPFSFESALSLIPSAEVIPQDIVTTQTPAIYSGISAVNSAVNPLFTQYLTPGDHTLETVLFYASVVWLAGVAVMLLYSMISYWRLHRRVQISIQIQNNIYVCDHIDSPFILGSFFPRIYIPSGIDGGVLQYVLAHENAHLKRLDHWWKPLGFLLLTVYWFNPLLWLAYCLLCRDIECACDEKVIAGMDNAGKKAYSEALIECSVHRRLIMACPVAFGEIGVKTRIRSILSYRKPAFWIMLAAAAACTATVVCFLTNPLPCFHAYDSVITESATCTRKGMQTLTCKRCNHSYTKPVDLLAHTYSEGKVLVEPNCIHQGRMEKTCTVCGGVKIEVMEKTAHTLSSPFLSKEANCTEAGEISAMCTLCYSVHTVEIIAPNQNHNLQETVIKEATCEDSGKGIITCSRCDYAESCTYEPHGHNYVDGAISLANSTVMRECTQCDDKYAVTLTTISEFTTRISYQKTTNNTPPWVSEQSNSNIMWFGSKSNQPSIPGTDVLPQLPQMPSLPNTFISPGVQ